MQMLFGSIQKHFDQILQHLDCVQAGDLGVHVRIQSDLVVPAASGVQTLTGFPDALGQKRFDIHMNVFCVHVPLYFAFTGILKNAFEAFDDPVRILPGDDVLLAEHGCMGYRALNILFI